jgi:hypothetical protein
MDAVLGIPGIADEFIILRCVERLKLLVHSVNCLIILPYFTEVLPYVFYDSVIQSM